MERTGGVYIVAHGIGLEISPCFKSCYDSSNDSNLLFPKFSQTVKNDSRFRLVRKKREIMERMHDYKNYAKIELAKSKRNGKSFYSV